MGRDDLMIVVVSLIREFPLISVHFLPCFQCIPWANKNCSLPVLDEPAEPDARAFRLMSVR